jgi:hypothetical protein
MPSSAVSSAKKYKYQELMEVGKMEPTDATTQAKCQSEEKHRSAC